MKYTRQEDSFYTGTFVDSSLDVSRFTKCHLLKQTCWFWMSSPSPDQRSRLWEILPKTPWGGSPGGNSVYTSRKAPFLEASLGGSPVSSRRLMTSSQPRAGLPKGDLVFRGNGGHCHPHFLTRFLSRDRLLTVLSPISLLCSPPPT